jgi:ferredoxin-NADP reductase
LCLHHTLLFSPVHIGPKLKSRSTMRCYTLLCMPRKHRDLSIGVLLVAHELGTRRRCSPIRRSVEKLGNNFSF